MNRLSSAPPHPDGDVPASAGASGGGHGPAPAAGRDIVILGAGIAGLTAATKLSDSGHRVTIVEQTDRCGGAHRSRQIGPYRFDVGSIFYEDRASLFELAEGLHDMCPEVRRMQRRLGPEGAFLHYPVDPRELRRWPVKQQLRALAGLARGRLTGRRDGTLDAICRMRLGSSIYVDTGLRDYTERFNHVPPTKIDEDFFVQRMGFIEKQTRLKSIARAAWLAATRKPVRKGPPVPLRVSPAAGFDPLFDRIRARLESRGVAFAMSEGLKSVARSQAGYVVSTTKATRRADAVVSTVPLDTVHRALFGCGTDLQSLDMLTLFVSAASLSPDAGNVFFNFSREGRWKRATVYSRIYPELAQDREFFSVEVTLAPATQPDPDRAFADLKTHLEGLGLATGIALEGYERVESAYPLYRCGYGQVLAEVIGKVQVEGVIMAGRQGRFDYLPTSSGVIRQVGAELGSSGLVGS